MREAHGAWLIFVDADDRLAPDHLALFMEAVEKAAVKPDIVVGGFTLEQPDFGYVSQLPLPADCDKRSLMLNADGFIRCVVWNKLFRLEFARQLEFNPCYTMHEDTAYCTRQFGRTDRIATIPMTGYRYIMCFAGSSISHYAKCCEEAQGEITANMHRVYQQVGLQGEELEKMDLQRLFDQNADCLRNIFKKDSPLSLRQKRSEVKRLLFDAPKISKAVEQYPKEGQTQSVKLFCLCHTLHSSTVATFLLEILYRYKHSRMHKQS